MMASLFDSELNKSVLVLAMASALTACGGGSSSSVSDNDEEEHEHEGGRVIYSISNDTGLSLYDQTAEEADAFENNVVSTSTMSATLVLANNGLTAAMIDNGALSIVKSGLEHLEDEDGHTHDVEASVTSLTSGVTQVIATHEYFSAFDGTDSTVIDAEDGTVETTSTDVTFPTLALTGGHYLTFTSGTDEATVLEVVEAGGEPLSTPVTLTCSSGGITTSAQTEHLTQVLCGNGTLLTLIAEESEADTIFTTNSVADSGFNNLTVVSSEDDVIAAWNATSALLKLNIAHDDHTDSKDISDEVTSESILAVAAPTGDETEVVGVLGTDGKFTVIYYSIENDAVVVDSADTKSFIIDSQATWDQGDSLHADSSNFIAINKGASNLYFIDGHEGNPYHVHDTYSDASLASVASAVFTYASEDHDHEDGEVHEHDDDEEHSHSN